MAVDNDRHDEARMVASRLDYLQRHARAEFEIKPGADITGRPPIFYLPDQLVTTAESKDVVQRILDKLFDGCGEPEALTTYDNSLVVFRIGEDSLKTAEHVRRAADELGEDVAVAPLHVLTPAPGPQIGPGDDPDPASRHARGAQGPGVEPLAPVAVIDTGLWTDPPHPLAAAIAAGGEEQVDVNPDDGFVDYYGSGHGGFIGGVIENNAPGAKVIAHNAFHKGVLTEASVINEIDAALLKSDIVVLNVSLGSYEQADGESRGVELLALRRAMRRWRKENPNSLIVAAAGNDSTSHPFFPAGFAAEKEFADMVVSVGALGEPAKGAGILAAPAHFSNHGDWVTAWAPGERIVSYYPKGLSFGYTDAAGNVVTSSTFADGLAYWSGTSFAAPFVAAEIIREMRDGESPRDTWKRIRGASPFVIFWPSW